MYFSILRRPLPGTGASLLSAFWMVVFAVVLNVPNVAVAQSDEEMSDYDYESEMGMESGYDEEMMGYGSSGPPGRSSRGGATMQEIAVADLTQALSAAFQATRIETLADPNAAPPVQSGPVLLNEALIAYSKGEYPIALNLYFGHIVTEYDNAQAELQRIKYSPLMRRPAWQVRWGISYVVRGDSVDPQPIQDTGPVNRGGFGDDGMDMQMEEYENQMAMDGGAGRGPAGRGAAGRGPAGRGMSQEEMDMAMDMEMNMEMEEMYNQNEMEMMGGMSGGPRRNSAPVAAPTPAARLAQLERPMLSDEAQQQLSESLGVVIDIIGEEFDKRYAQGDFGRAMADITASSGNVETVSESFVKMMESSGDSLPLWRAGMTFLGQGDWQTNTVAARKAGLDIMLQVDVILKQRGEFTQNTCRCRLVHVPTGKSLGISKPIDSLEFAQMNRAKQTAARDYVHDQLQNFFEIIDKQTVTSELPTLTAEIAKKRIGSLLASGGGMNLRTLAEVRLFQSQGLLTEDEVLTAFDIVGGEEAMQLIYASEDERLRIVHEWASRKPGAE
ncbi:MAG: hypothetical protein KDB00_19260 [Planctomycetales bacterium]|nr:hypothetical protein [Planctomycetales bacterium]